jgi:hypothetical protein
MTFISRHLAGLLGAAALGFMLVGCASDAPPTQSMSGNDVQNALANAKPQDQIDWWRRSPSPPEEKAAKIKAIQKKYGLPEDPPSPNMGGH